MLDGFKLHFPFSGLALNDSVFFIMLYFLIALTAANEEAQRFYRSVPRSVMRDTGIWIDVP